MAFAYIKSDEFIAKKKHLKIDSYRRWRYEMPVVFVLRIDWATQFVIYAAKRQKSWDKLGRKAVIFWNIGLIFGNFWFKSFNWTQTLCQQYSPQCEQLTRQCSVLINITSKYKKWWLLINNCPLEKNKWNYDRWSTVTHMKKQSILYNNKHLGSCIEKRALRTRRTPLRFLCWEGCCPKQSNTVLNPRKSVLVSIAASRISASFFLSFESNTSRAWRVVSFHFTKYSLPSRDNF